MIWLVVQPLWKILVSWDYYSQYMEKNVPNHQSEMDVVNCISTTESCYIMFITNFSYKPGEDWPGFASARDARGHFSLKTSGISGRW